MSASASTHGAGGRVGRFELLDVLGRGAQAVVWLANDQRLDREVALKLLSPDAQAISVNQWLHEARAVSRLTHPNIVPVFEADEAEGQPYLVFELRARPDAGRSAAAQRRDARARGGDVDARRAGRAACSARAGHRAPRPEAVEHPARRRWPSAGDGLRHRRTRQRRRRARLRHTGLHVARGGAAAGRRRRPWTCSPPA